MSKYSFEEKLEAVLRVINDGMSHAESGHIIGCHSSDICKWVELYNRHGASALLPGGTSYTGEFKVMVVEYMHSNHMYCRSTAAHFGIKCHSHVAKWERIYYEEGPNALLQYKPRGRPPKGMNKKEKTELSEQTKEDLIAEVQRLRMENEYLKKLRALVQERIERENGNVPPSSTN